jgi:hypothetical protein
MSAFGGKADIDQPLLTNLDLRVHGLANEVRFRRAGGGITLLSLGASPAAALPSTAWLPGRTSALGQKLTRLRIIDLVRLVP